MMVNAFDGNFVRVCRRRSAYMLLTGVLLMSACGQTDTADKNTAPASETDAPSPAPVETKATGPAFRCSGAEPFWSLRVNGAALTLQTPDRNGDNAIILSGGWDAAAPSDQLLWIAENETSKFQIRKEQCIAESGMEFSYAADAAALLGIDTPAPGCCEKISADSLE